MLDSRAGQDGLQLMLTLRAAPVGEGTNWRWR